ncbi:MAG TPA: rhomboid family intramembrane serine protease [Thermoanaerobaculia bacterium]|nr:rhomboid family intramembrane serine protease [Thermoanaerobaculia bacterium]
MIVTLFLAALAAAATFLGNASALQYARGAAPWTLLTCHFTHWSTDQFLWGLAVFVPLGIACERRSRTRFLLALSGSAVAVPLLVGALAPSIGSYRGLSGLDSALFALLACMIAGERKSGDRATLLLILAAALGFGGKIAYELFTGSPMFASQLGHGIVPVPLAHAVGAVAGVVAAFAPLPAFNSLQRRTACS